MNYYVYVFINKNTHHLIVDTELNNKYFSILVFPSSDPGNIDTIYFMIGDCSTRSLCCLCAGNALEDGGPRGCVAGACHHLLSHLSDLQLETDLGISMISTKMVRV